MQENCLNFSNTALQEISINLLFFIFGECSSVLIFIMMPNIGKRVITFILHFSSDNMYKVAKKGSKRMLQLRLLTLQGKMLQSPSSNFRLLLIFKNWFFIFLLKVWILIHNFKFTFPPKWTKSQIFKSKFNYLNNINIHLNQFINL